MPNKETGLTRVENIETKKPYRCPPELIETRMLSQCLASYKTLAVLGLFVNLTNQKTGILMVYGNKIWAHINL
jgi:hypothetical protein